MTRFMDLRTYYAVQKVTIISSRAMIGIGVGIAIGIHTNKHNPSSSVLSVVHTFSATLRLCARKGENMGNRCIFSISILNLDFDLDLYVYSAHLSVLCGWNGEGQGAWVTYSIPIATPTPKKVSASGSELFWTGMPWFSNLSPPCFYCYFSCSCSVRP